jgi:hypothetical protein
MSYDIKIQNKCDHKINWEAYTLESDLVTIQLAYPVASVYSVLLRIDNVAIDPSQYTVQMTRKALSLQPSSLIRMRHKVKNWQPLIEVNYVTYPNNCPKCGGVNTIDDLSYSSAGDFLMAKKEYLLVQAVEKIITTKFNSNPFHGWYGTGLQSLIGSKITDLAYLKTKITEQISSAMETLKSIQKQLVTSNRQVDPGELFGQLLSVDIQQTEDPTIIFVTVTFTSQSKQTLEYSQLIDLSTTRAKVSFV